MTLTHHDLHHEFPEHGEILHALKMENAHYRVLAERYDVASKTIYRIQADLEPATDERLEALKKERLAMLDEVAAMIASRQRRNQQATPAG